MVVTRLIERKRDGGVLTAAEWRAVITAYATGDVPDYQMSALAMAIVFRGLDPDELAALTDAMLHSGKTLALSRASSPVVDKHSTGGVGDKTSLLLAPMLAACGARVPMMSGRGLGHTGGTLDKLESIPGFRVDLGLERAAAQVDRIGVAMFGQTDEIAPADRKLYALRDVTGTVESIPLISASIMSKKLAEGLDGLVLDVKAGSGAFLPDVARAEELALTMIRIGHANGCPTVALITAMDRPLGVACGNALEVAEAIAALRGDGPDDLLAVTLALGTEMLRLAGIARDHAEALRRLRRVIDDGSALRRLGEMIKAQGGDPAVIDSPNALPAAAVIRDVRADRGGVVQQVAPRTIGQLVIELGGGRERVTDSIDHSVGIEVFARPGARVRSGFVVARLHARNASEAEAAERHVREAIVIGDETPAMLPLILSRVTINGVEPWEGGA